MQRRKISWRFSGNEKQQTQRMHLEMKSYCVTEEVSESVEKNPALLGNLTAYQFPNHELKILKSRIYG